MSNYFYLTHLKRSHFNFYTILISHSVYNVMLLKWGILSNYLYLNSYCNFSPCLCMHWGFFHQMFSPLGMHRLLVLLLRMFEFPEIFQKIIEEGDFPPCIVFNTDVTGLCWKRMPSRACISHKEKLQVNQKITYSSSW